MRIERMSPDLADDYFRLFDQAFPDNPEWAGCFCAYYDDPRPDDTWDGPDTEAFAAENRANRRTTIEAGGAHGLLAYEDGAPIGWLNAGPRETFGNLRVFAAAIEPQDPPVGSLMCFVVHPEHRGKGVATALLDAADDHLRDLGMDIAEAYPRPAPPDNPDFAWTAAFYKGTPAMYEAAGYQPHAQHERFTVVRKALR